MSRKYTRVDYQLDAKDVRYLPQHEIVAILRGADDLIMSGGRSLLTKVLKGSKDKKVLELGLNNSPVYGYYQELTAEQVLARIDWVILHGYLAIEYDWRLPKLVYTPKGWEIERETYAKELLFEFDEMLENKPPPYNMTYLKDRNRDMILLLLDMVEATKDPKYIPLLQDWEAIDYKKVRARIQEVIKAIQRNTLTDQHG
jgi:superfamily II DNA helicase RecQ